MSPAARRPLLRIATPPAGSAHHLVVHSAVELEQLRPRKPASAIRAAHPGAGVRHGGQLYEVVAALAGEPPFPYAYHLTRAEPDFTLRTFLDLEPAGIAALEAGLAAERTRLQRLAGLTLTLPLVGLLPRDRLLALQQSVGLDPKRAVNASALLLLAIFAPQAVAGLILILASALGSSSIAGASSFVPFPALLPLAAFLTAESVVRLLDLEPSGSALVVLAARVLEETRLVARLPDPARERARVRAAAARVSHLVDRVARVPGPGGRGVEMHIESAAPKPWSDAVCVVFEDRAWRVASQKEQVRGGRTVHVTVLADADEMTLVRRHVAYRPDEALLEKQAQERRDFADRLRVWKPLAGFLPAEIQERWAREHGFDARGATRLSAVMETFVAGSNVVVSIALGVRHPQWAFLEVLTGVTFSIFLFEGVARLWQVGRHGLASGSVLVFWVRR